MARAKKSRSYFEPWKAARSVRVGNVPNVEGLPEDAAQAILDAHGRAVDNAPFYIWAEAGVPGITAALTDLIPKYVDGQRPLFQIDKLRGLPEKSPEHGEIAERVVECVNALAGVADPARVMADVRALLMGYLNGECLHDPREDPKVVSLLSRCIPPQDREKLEHFSDEE